MLRHYEGRSTVCDQGCTAACQSVKKNVAASACRPTALHALSGKATAACGGLVAL